MLQSLAASVPWVQRACSPAVWVVVDTIWMVEFSARVTLYGGQEPATPTIFLGGCSQQHAGSGGGAAGYEWGGQRQTTFSRHAGALRVDMLWSQEWVFDLRHANRPSTMLPFLDLQFDMASSSAATPGSHSTLHRVDWVRDASEAHIPHLRARSHVAVRRSPVSGRLHRRGLEFPREKNLVRGTPSLHFLQRQQCSCRVEDPEPLFTERWHYTVPPNVRSSVFAFQRDPNSDKHGSQRCA